LDGGADVNAKDEEGWTALTWEETEARTDIVELLKKAEAGE